MYKPQGRIKNALGASKSNLSFFFPVLLTTKASGTTARACLKMHRHISATKPRK